MGRLNFRISESKLQTKEDPEGLKSRNPTSDAVKTANGLRRPRQQQLFTMPATPALEEIRGGLNKFYLREEGGNDSHKCAYNWKPRRRAALTAA